MLIDMVSSGKVLHRIITDDIAVVEQEPTGFSSLCAEAVPGGTEQVLREKGYYTHALCQLQAEYIIKVK